MALTSGTRLAHYEILEQVGEGRIGEVFRARDVTLGQEVGLEILQGCRAVPDSFVGSFETEVRLLAQLNHSNIGALHAFEVHDGQQIIVKELVEGESLAERMARGPLPLDEALGIATDVVEALEAAHTQGIVHRDLNPANIMLTPDGKVKVLNFGLATVLMQHRPTNVTGVIFLLTPAYVSPEQARAKVTDAGSDIFSFGSVLYEMLTGKRAFREEERWRLFPAIIHKHPDWRAIPSQVLPQVRELLKRCLEKDPRNRPDIGELRVSLVSTDN